ncbi:undecaprenyldiphospho-muramoylpentapeptide beta-N-acetylglucosaminyltransferase [Alkalicoccus luteus]|uniref:UDP-N-acetylglucosamine--N-acetylmuramyl-(pentapeptide) pyrophosphoryl-undecaprenol N-acetylglucosamine transferase n=1 Tax=Alkalicoccus luteus TaxID=1237094 RepID=A0A969TTM8_9BACI|nr:undecaprenyldiphospho-muramoylpentapeptide beta-N-acetylglucosaminyltransferase [Alkalicoccus luteus]NJP36445.1 undecaprenyldiphospho-muramoylpentapeptide beta-N-acetylglucosaminyltransferase [Alkalicoccus luteus]
MRIAVSGGGTGGHIYPALALIRHMQRKEATDVLYIGTERGLESTLVPEAGIPFKSVHITGFKRSLSFENVKTVLRFVKAVRQSKAYLKAFKPDVVIGTGGYVCGPVVYAAAKLGIPTLIHEQNSVPGITNKFLARYADKVAVCFDEAVTRFPENKVVYTGNPRASEAVEAEDNPSVLKEHGFNPDKPVFVIAGGSRGAAPINQAVLDAYSELAKKDYQILYVTGSVHYEAIQKKLPAYEADSIITVPYVENMPVLLRQVRGAVGRAGATSIAELTALGVPAVYIPSPYVTENHQFHNADAYVKKGAALMIEEKDLNAETLIAALDSLQDTAFAADMSQKAKEAGMPQAAAMLADELNALGRS